MKWNVSHTEIEDGIYAVWGLTDMIKTFLWRYCDHPKPMTEDEVYNHIYSIECLLDLHCEKLMDTYCKVYELNEYASEEAKAYREKLFNGAGVQKALKDIKEEQNKKTKGKK
jgi:hypothetical protein